MNVEFVKKINNYFFSYTLKDRVGKFNSEMDFLKSFKEPKDLFERSFFQYKAQKFILGDWKFIIFNLLLFYIPFLVLLFRLIIFLFRKKRNNAEQKDILGAIAIFDTIPEELLQNKKLNVFKSSYSFLRSDIVFISKLALRYWFEPFFLLKSILKVALYSKNIQLTNPKTIIVQNEYSFTSSLLTEYCRSHNILHVNVMHGEKLFLIRDSFFEYDKCYVWNEHYKQLFIDLRANTKQFIIKMPEKFLKMQEYSDKEGKTKYYLNGSETKKDILIIKEKNPEFVFRLHPRYKNKWLIDNETIICEYPTEVSIEESISESCLVCARYSTVLFQAWLKGKKVIIDDLTDKRLYKELKLRNYFLLKQNVLHLSDL